MKIDVEATETYLKVSDNGIGIFVKAYCPNIRPVLSRAQKGEIYPVGGHGIGLYYVNNICTRMGWTITATSRLGKGTIFTIFSIKKERDEHTILLVEDEQTNVEDYC